MRSDGSLMVIVWWLLYVHRRNKELLAILLYLVVDVLLYVCPNYSS